MPRGSRLQGVWPRVRDFLADQPSRVLREPDLRDLMGVVRTRFKLPATQSLSAFLEKALTDGVLRRVELVAENPPPDAGPGYAPVTRYALGTPSPAALGLSLRSGSYLSHGSALALNGLTDALPKTVYVNKEQSAKPPPSGQLTQQAIDRAFRNKARESNYVFAGDGYRFVLLAGKNTGRLEVTPIRDTAGGWVDVTKVERTLIDVTVRPAYAGGVFDVLEAYRVARDRISLPTLVATLKRLDYVYPYHQAIGFYLERVGVDPAKLERFRALGLQHDFYLANRIPDPRFDPSWRIHHPAGL